MKTLLFLIITFAIYTEQKSTTESDHYKGAVVEYMVSRNTEINLHNYITFIEDASEQDVDVIVFPEMTLYIGGLVEVPIHGDLKEYPVPAEHPDKYHEILVKLSEAAKLGQIYVVINIQEVMNCSIAAEAEECPDDKTYRFNTNVVFDRNGAVIDRFRKINLFGENRSPALKPDLGIFTTDFGVTFGHFICFDLLFQIPANQVIEKHQVTDILFPSMWFSELPYLTAVQIQEAFAYAKNVNFLAAGANNVGVGSAGSGIYSGKAGALISIMPATPTTRMLVADIPKAPGMIKTKYPGHIAEDPNKIDRIAMIRDPSLGAHITRLLVAGNNDFTLEYEDMRCRFRVNLNYQTSEKVYSYRAGVLDGIRTYSGLASGGVRICSVFACVNETIEGCGISYDNYVKERTAVFRRLEITATGPSPQLTEINARDSFYYAVSSDVTLMPLKSEDYKFNVKSGVRGEYELILVNHDVELLGFAVWGRVFDRDGGEPTPDYDSAMIHGINSLLIFITVALVIFKQY